MNALLTHLRSAFPGHFLPDPGVSADQNEEREDSSAGAGASAAAGGAGVHTGACTEGSLHVASAGWAPSRRGTQPLCEPPRGVKVTGPSAFQEVVPEPDKRLLTTQNDHQEQPQQPQELAGYLDEPTLERAAAEGCPEGDQPPEGRLEKEREARIGSEASFQGPRGNRATEEEEEGPEEVRDPEEAREEGEERPQEEGLDCHWAPVALTSLPQLRPQQRPPQLPQPRDMPRLPTLLSLPPSPLRCMFCPVEATPPALYLRGRDELQNPPDMGGGVPVNHQGGLPDSALPVSVGG